MPELKKEIEVLDKNHERGSAHVLVDLHNARTDAQAGVLPTVGGIVKGTATGIGGMVGGIFGGGADAKPAEKPKGK